MYDVLIVGGGASGAALLHVLANYTNIGRLGLVEKYPEAGQVNSKASNNSQTLHVGDIETNYSIEKVKTVYPAAMMLARYAEQLPVVQRDSFLFPMPKMVIGVGETEVRELETRFQALKGIFPALRLLTREEIAVREPNIVKGRDPAIPLTAIAADGFAVDFEQLAKILIGNVKRDHPQTDVFFSHQVERIAKTEQGYELHFTNGKTLQTRVLVVDADSYSLLLAKQLGYGTEFSLIPIAGNFYFSAPLLNGKVYTVQEPKLPFAAVHGDPDVRMPGKTRWGPTARFHPVLEARNMRTSLDFLASSGLNRLQTWFSFAAILLDPVRFFYLLENMLYELPLVGTWMFLKHVRKIVPTIRFSDVTLARGYGGMRLQRVDTRTRELLLGEGKIVGDRAIFNMTPSPGASVCLYNAMRDASLVVKFLEDGSRFDETRLKRELYAPLDGAGDSQDTSLKSSYAS
ncbi:MAG TPA: FAD-dependent oxidoreductase [Verrucomicrobiae bacterium]|nr:FAD-dependent oxidoreductase [Verrucomicrobiae bacterium]